MAAACLKIANRLPVRLMFQDEARFGRMSNPRSCWAPAPYRPVVNLALIREFRYEYATVSPWDGCLDFMTTEKMNTENMSLFLTQVGETHKGEFIVNGAHAISDVTAGGSKGMGKIFIRTSRKEKNGIQIRISDTG